MKDFEGTTYAEWLDYHIKVSRPEIVKKILEVDSKRMIYWPVKKEKD